MNPIDQAFLNAYAKKKSVPRPQERSAPTEQVRPLGEQTADKRSFAHVPTQPAKPPQPHFEMGAMNTPSKRSPSIVVPTDAVPSVSLKAGRDSISPNEPTIRIRLDHASETKTRFPVPHVALQPLNVTSGPVEKVSEVQRRTLTSYLQKSRDSVAALRKRCPRRSHPQPIPLLQRVGQRQEILRLRFIESIQHTRSIRPWRVQNQTFLGVNSVPSEQLNRRQILNRRPLEP